MAKKKRKKKGFGTEQKTEAMRLIQEGHTQKQVAAQVGCSVASLQSWKKQFATEKPSPRGAKYEEPKDEVVKSQPSQVPFDKFVRKYWEGRAVDVLLMESTVSSEIVKRVNEALRYAYDSLQR